MLDADLSVDRQLEDARQPERRRDMKSGSGRREILNATGEFLPGWAELDHAAAMRGHTRVIPPLVFGECIGHLRCPLRDFVFARFRSGRAR